MPLSARLSVFILILLACFAALGSQKESGLGSLKIYDEGQDCLFVPPPAEHFEVCPLPDLPTRVRRVPREGVADVALLAPLVDAGLQTLGGVLKAAGSESSVSRIQGTTISAGGETRCLLIVHAKFSSLGTGQSLADYLKSRNDVSAVDVDRCEANGRVYSRTCVSNAGSLPGCEAAVVPALYNIDLASQISFAAEPSFILELQLDEPMPGFIRFSPTYVEYASTLRSGGSGTRDLILLAHAASSDALSPFSRENASSIAKDAHVLFDWEGTKTGSVAWSGRYEPWTPWLRYTSEDTEKQILTGDYSLWFALVETKRGSKFLHALGANLGSQETQSTLSGFALERATGLYSEDGKRVRSEAAQEMKELASARHALTGRAVTYCVNQVPDQVALEVERSFYDYQSAYADAEQAMRAIGRRIDGNQYPKPGSNFGVEWTRDLICGGV